MSRSVFPNSMVAHVWAQHTQPSGRSHNGNMSFDGGVLYSYAAPIGLITQDVAGRRVYLLSTRNGSVTTSAHQSCARQAVPDGYAVFAVHDIDSYQDHAVNLAALVASYTDALAKARRKQHLWDDEGRREKGYAEAAIGYATAFGLPLPIIDPDADWAALLAFRAEREARLNTPEQAAKRSRDKERREQRAFDRAQRQREQALREASVSIAEWRQGIRHYLPYDAQRDVDGGALLRINGETLETSQGASVPLSHAIKVFRHVAACREAGRSWHRNGETIRVGHFQVDAIEPDGSFTAGCHKFNWPEIEAAAIVAGVIPAPAP